MNQFYLFYEVNASTYCTHNCHKRFRSVVVITLASHARGPGFETQRNHADTFLYYSTDGIYYTKNLWHTHTYERARTLKVILSSCMRCMLPLDRLPKTFIESVKNLFIDLVIIRPNVKIPLIQETRSLSDTNMCKFKLNWGRGL